MSERYSNPLQSTCVIPNHIQLDAFLDRGSENAQEVSENDGDNF